MSITLDIKLLREVGRLKGQVLTIALVLASGITSFVSLRGTHASLESSRDAYYDRARFAHVWANLERAPESLARELERLPGVAQVVTRVTDDVMIPIEGLERAASGRVFSLPPHGQPATNALTLLLGRTPAAGRNDEVVLLQSFADAHGLRPGHRLPVVINGKQRDLTVVGVALSPEFVYAIRPGALVDDPRRYAILWMERSTLAAALRLEGAFNEVSLRLQPGGSEAAALTALERVLAPYGSGGAFARSQQISHKILNDELAMLAGIAAMVPVVFLLVAAFLMNMVLGRMISLQRTEIAALKALGFFNREIGAHYLGLVGIILLPSAIAGLVGGHLLGEATLALYAKFFRFPALRFAADPAVMGTAVLVSAASAVLGGVLAVRAAARLPPAEAMRPPAPARYRRGLLDRLGLGGLLGPAGMMVVRELTRRPLRLALSSLGIAGAIALMILGRFGWDSMQAYLETTTFREQRQDLVVTFVGPRPLRAVSELAARPGVLRAEGLRTVAARIRSGTRQRDVPIMGLPANGTLRRLIERDGGERALPREGVLLSRELARALELRVGDRAHLELREGDRRTITPVITGLVDDTVGLQVYAAHEELAALLGDAGAISAALLQVDATARAQLFDHLRRAPFVLEVSDLRADVERMRSMQEGAFRVWTMVAVSLGAAVILGVVYNNARITLAQRSRELATHRVLGFSRGEISGILLGGLAVEVILAIPLGLLLGRGWASVFMVNVDTETYRWAIFIAPATYLFAAGVAAAAAAASALWVRRSLDRLDLIAVLKTRE